tara:strand:- start:600 stop:794 length:195 start_codon:yes stop_codon:yes gene_type:complete
MTHENSDMSHRLVVRFPAPRELFRLWWRRDTAWRALARLTTEALAGIGLSEAQRAAETARPLWR